MKIDVLIVGAGFAGAVAAQRLAEAGRRVLLIDRRDHVGGNAFDEYDRHGVLVHRYGPHIFHTNSLRVWNYLTQFTPWRTYEHRVLAKIDEQLLPIPINRTTLNRLYNLSLDEAGAAAFLERVREPRTEIRTSEDVVLAAVGRDLCDKFFRGYTRKQWGRDLSGLGPGVLARIPTRTNCDDRYFGDTYQAMPLEGFTRMFQRILDHPNITVELGQDFVRSDSRYSPALTVYTGSIDNYFDHCLGHLPYRSLVFEHEHINQEWYQPAAVVNYPNDFDFTRITEFKHLTGQSHCGTSIVREYPQSDGEAYYPIPCPESADMFVRYEALARTEPSVIFLGRLAQFRYYNMDQVVASVLTAVDRITGRSGDKMPLLTPTQNTEEAPPAMTSTGSAWRQQPDTP
jgi:UDP-galactopyranose mutase